LLGSGTGGGGVMSRTTVPRKKRLSVDAYMVSLRLMGMQLHASVGLGQRIASIIACSPRTAQVVVVIMILSLCAAVAAPVLVAG
jgi:hypothetical protein